MLWGGEVCSSRDAHIASTILQAATFPFLAFLSLQPSAPSRLIGSHNSTSHSRMTVFSRFEGLQQTTINSLRQHIVETLLPRLGPFLNRLKAQKRDRDMQRLLREDQDRAYAEAGKRDLERVRAKEAEIKASRDAEEGKKNKELARLREGRNREAWRKNTAASFGAEAADGTRIVIRLPDGKRLMRRFGANEQAKRMWHFVECEAHGFPIPSSSSRTKPPSTSTMDPGYQPHLSFSLATTFPRRKLQLQDVDGKTIVQLVDEGLLDKQAANLIVEGLSQSAGREGDTDEDDEEEEV